MDLFWKSQHWNSMVFSRKIMAVVCFEKCGRGGWLGVPINKIISLMEVLGWLPRHPCTWQRWWGTQRWQMSLWFDIDLPSPDITNNVQSTYLEKSVVHAYIYYQWKACIWARLIFGLLIIRLDIVSLRYMRTTFTYFWYHIFRLSFGSFGFFGIHNFRY